MLCHHFIVNFSFISYQTFFDFIEDENAPALPTLDDHQQNDNRMDIDGANQGLQHIPGVDDTTLLSNVSDEFVLPPISTTGKIKIENYKFLFYFLFNSTNTCSSTSSKT